MLVTGIKSKPVYTPLSADTRGRYHLMLGMGVGDEALLRVLREMQASAPGALAATRVLLVPQTANGAVHAAQPPHERFEKLGLGEIRLFADASSLLADFKSILALALMGTRLYVAGPESFIGLAMKIALEFNLNKDEIRAEECGTLARRVYCIHCRATTEEVKTNIVKCVGCGLWLLVRDHYSRRLAAYMGVMADAEAPGELPEIKEVFL
jgi:dimethylamine monooxygenase subunit C